MPVTIGKGLSFCGRALSDAELALIRQVTREFAHLALTELAATLGRMNIEKDEMEEALTVLEREGVVMIRDHFCADPHLAGVDLRVVALVESIDGADAQLSAIREIDSAWDKWLAEYLANHRCS